MRADVQERVRQVQAECASLWSPALKAVLVLGVLLSLGLRLLPLTDLHGRIWWQFMSEDGYLMQTIARNMAIGLGMSTAEGTIATNGVQPLATFFFAAMHSLAGGDKLIGVVLADVYQAVVSVLAMAVLYRLFARVFGAWTHARACAAVLAVVWGLAPTVFRHSVNGLETSTYYLFLLLALERYQALTADGAMAGGLRPGQQVQLGLFLGLAFLARNDAVFFIASLLLAHIALGEPAQRLRRFGDAVVAGVVSLVVASPWLVHNYRLFGSVVPISGTAQSHHTALGSNLALIPSNLVKALTLYLPIPQSLETRPVVVAGCVAVLLGFAVLAWRVLPWASLALRRLVFTTLMFAVCLCGYYGVFFGAAHFVPRYVSALSPLLAVLLGGVLFSLFWLSAGVRQRAGWALPGVVLGLMAAGTFAASHAKYADSPHRQVVQWVQAHVPDDQWVGAVQTGTLGYFHDRTLNLDGKVNPAALRQVLATRDVRPYVLTQPIVCVADWYSIKVWLDPGAPADFAERYTLLVQDEPANLSVMCRKDWVQAQRQQGKAL